MRWALVHRVAIPGVRRRQTVARALIIDVPDNVGRLAVLHALEEAGLGPRYASAGVPFANHALVKEGAWPEAFDAGPAPDEWSWEALTGPLGARRLGLRLEPAEWAAVTTAAAREGLSVQAWARAVLVARAIAVPPRQLEVLP